MTREYFKKREHSLCISWRQRKKRRTDHSNQSCKRNHEYIIKLRQTLEYPITFQSISANLSKKRFTKDTL